MYNPEIKEGMAQYANSGKMRYQSSISITVK